MKMTAALIPTADQFEWQLRGACRGANPETFFHPQNERGPSRRARTTAAKAVCRTCPVVAECLTWAIKHREEYGVWGGLDEHERAGLTRPAA